MSALLDLDRTRVKELTARELQVLGGMSRGRSNGDIGGELGLSEDTIKTHARRLFRKLGARDRAHAVALAYQTGVLSTSPSPDPVPEVDDQIVLWGPAHEPTPEPSITLSVSDQDAALLASAVWPQHMNRAVTVVRAREALARLIGVIV